MPSAEPKVNGAEGERAGPRTFIAQTEDFLLELLPGHVYLATVRGHFALRVMTSILEAVWADPGWKQPWGLVLDIDETTTYDTDLRQHAMPPPDRRSVGTAIVSTKAVYRMVISSIGIGMRLAHRFNLSAHTHLEEATEQQRKVVATVEAAGRPY